MRQLRLDFSGKKTKTRQRSPTQKQPRSERPCKLNIPLFYELTQNPTLYPHNPRWGIERKREILEQCNYPRLKVATRESINVRAARWERIGRAFADIYDRVQKKYAAINTALLS